MDVISKEDIAKQTRKLRGRLYLRRREVTIQEAIKTAIEYGIDAGLVKSMTL